MSTLFTLPIKSDHIRKIADPFASLETFYVLCPVEVLPDFPVDDTNPREQNFRSDVAKRIRDSLWKMDGRFHVLNRGITVSVASANYDNKTEKLSLELFDDTKHGNIDGGHTQRIVRQAVGEADWEQQKKERAEAGEPVRSQYVRLEIISKLPPEFPIWELAEARNKSVQVKEFALANLAGKFKWLKQELKAYEAVILYKENEDKPVNVRDVLALLTLFNTKLFPLDGDSYPIKAYTNKSKPLELFDEHQESFQMLRPIMTEILKLYDYIRARMKEIYNETGGKFGRWGVVEERQTVFYFLENMPPVDFRVPDGIVYPILGSFRFLLKDHRGELKWKVDDVQKFYDKFGHRLIKIALETARMMGNNPGAAGKNENLWAQLYNEVRLAYYELRDVDVNADVHVGETEREIGDRK